jgi:hypothetical protein
VCIDLKAQGVRLMRCSNFGKQEGDFELGIESISAVKLRVKASAGRTWLEKIKDIMYGMLTMSSNE